MSPDSLRYAAIFSGPTYRKQTSKPKPDISMVINRWRRVSSVAAVRLKATITINIAALVPEKYTPAKPKTINIKARTRRGLLTVDRQMINATTVAIAASNPNPLDEECKVLHRGGSK